MTDYLVKALAFNGEIRAMATRTTDTVSEAQKRHDTWRAATAALGRTMTGSLLLGAMHKNDEKLTVKIQADGPVGAIVVDVDGKGNVKGYVKNPEVNLPPNELGKIDVRGAVGTNGTFSVVKDLGLKEPVTGQVPIVSGEIAEDFTYYLANSEQVPSAVGLSVLVDNTDGDCVKAAGGFVIQVMPGASEATIVEIEKRLADIPQVSTLLDQGETPEAILNRLLGEENVEILETMPVQFFCDCSKERFASAIVTLGERELTKMIEEDEGAEAVCHFCGEKYQYNAAELTELRDEAIK
ncbi:Hsp33 family molecular chaperone HslO [Vagococcus carniphilus]|uniref:Hsp33 family molecular chaperone HslO n=1 Tax=Vagococcus carniphilus TaxID=218144 RepID=UPI00288F60DC|nr:Hsp33 family molecular chaperone HslO [Vagococcus carniphilus]MDT2831267.1 Hsp33 family molecular chaperone HslO [Vagococcus carniphilus]MDT2840399.1 Hsp33 family molecular chaperone HslO [Vagococcus carniphilus]MDT2854904.1 Hsp33 family molecular chaperone HslO [Vagococcus carniphilus]